MTTLKEMIAVMQAAEEGKSIQRRNRDLEQWEDCLPAWNWYNCEYRVKIEPVELKVWYKAGFSMQYHTDNDIKSWEAAGYRLITVREVMSD